IDSAAARALLQKARANGFWTLKDNFSASVDGSAAITTLHIGNREKQVTNRDGAAPAWLEELEIEIDVVADTHRWIHGDPRKELITPFSIGILADGNGGKPGVTPLMKAASTGNSSEVRRLLAGKPDLNARDVSGWTALVYAAHAMVAGNL